MKVGILTWYQAINHGAVLQTYASSEMLKAMGASPVILDYEWKIYDEEDKKNRMLRRLRNFTPSKLIWYLGVKKLLTHKSENFIEFISKYLNVGKTYDQEPGLDVAYIGSDMVFDITEGYNPYMHGGGVPAPYRFAYAASFGYSTIQAINQSGHKKEIVENLNTLKAIGYRDQKTFDLCKQLEITAPMTETIDPVLCYGFEKEIDTWDTGKWKQKKYILVYAYDSTMNDKETIKEIKIFARQQRLQIVSCGYYHKWCDMCVPAAPDEFLEMFKHAQYIVTDTFHGTVFSLILHKKFASIIRNNGFKVQYLLSCANLQSRIISEPGKFSEIITKPIDFTGFENWLANERKKSREYIKNNLEQAKEEIL